MANSPDKGVHLTIDVAQVSGLPLIVAGIIQDEAHFREHVKPHLDRQIRYIGAVDVKGKNELFSRARALLHMNTIPERFGLVLAEANAAGVSVIAMDLGSCREVIADGRTGFLVNSVHEGRGCARPALADRSGRLPRARAEPFLGRGDGQELRASFTRPSLSGKRAGTHENGRCQTLQPEPDPNQERCPLFRWKPFTTRLS